MQHDSGDSSLDPADDDGVELLLAMSTASTGELADDLSRALALATGFFGLEFGIISRVEGDRYVIEHVVQPEGAGLAPGAAFDLGTTYCAITLEAHDVISIAEMRSSPHSGHPCYESFQLESYLGVPLRIDGEVYGTLNFSSSRAAVRPWTEMDRQLVRLLAQWIGGSIAQDQLSVRLANALTDLGDANQQLVRRNQDLDDFARHASHDLQSPLKNVTALIGMLNEDLPETGSASVKEDMGMIVAEVDRMGQIVQALLAFSRASDGDIAMDRVPLDQCVDAACEALREFINESDADVTRESLPTVSGDVTLLTQVFQNLIGNAIKFQAPGTRPRIRISAQTDGGRVKASVADNGIGFQQEFAESIFAPLQRLHGPQAYPGSGLGLSICRRIVQRQGGFLEAESVMTEGSTFSLTLHGYEGEAEAQLQHCHGGAALPAGD